MKKGSVLYNNPRKASNYTWIALAYGGTPSNQLEASNATVEDFKTAQHLWAYSRIPWTNKQPYHLLPGEAMEEAHDVWNDTRMNKAMLFAYEQDKEKL